MKSHKERRCAGEIMAEALAILPPLFISLTEVEKQNKEALTKLVRQPEKASVESEYELRPWREMKQWVLLFETVNAIISGSGLGHESNKDTLFRHSETHVGDEFRCLWKVPQNCFSVQIKTTPCKLFFILCRSAAWHWKEMTFLLLLRHNKCKRTAQCKILNGVQ